MDTSAPPAYERAMTTKVKCDKSNLEINNMLPRIICCPAYIICAVVNVTQVSGEKNTLRPASGYVAGYPHALFPARGNATNEIVAVANETVPAWVETAVSDTFGKRIVRPSLSAGHSIA